MLDLVTYHVDGHTVLGQFGTDENSVGRLVGLIRASHLLAIRRLLDDGRELMVVTLIMGTARLMIGPAGANWYDDGW